MRHSVALTRGDKECNGKIVTPCNRIGFNLNWDITTVTDILRLFLREFDLRTRHEDIFERKHMPPRNTIRSNGILNIPIPYLRTLETGQVSAAS